MEKELSKLEKELLEIPGWKEMAVKLENLPTDAEFAKLHDEFEKSLALDLVYDISSVRLKSEQIQLVSVG